MTTPEPQLDVPPPSPSYQFSLRTLLLLFVVLGSSLAVFGGGGIVVFILLLLLATDRRRAVSPVALLRLLAALLCLGCLGAVFVRHVLESDPDRRCRKNLKLIVSALLNYEKANRCFPPAYSLDDSGKPMHSWRVQVLPYMEQSTLYEAYDFKKPWDSPENKSVCQTLLPTYECPSESREVRMSAAPQTSYLAVVGPNTAWSGVKPRKLADFGNQASHTIMVVELADSGVEWAEPRDFSLDVLGIVGATPRAIPLSSNHRPRDGFFYTYGHASGVNVAMADGSMHFLRTDNLSPDE
ncbi:MAG: DUF1559 domain-containing protein, partial [Thermoguttaceae bacterium]